MSHDFDLSADRLAAAGMFTNDDETHYYLCGVFIQPHADPKTGTGVLMVATDGHKMAVIHDPEGHADRAAILSLDFKAAALKTNKKDLLERRVRLTLDKGPRATVAPVETGSLIVGSVTVKEIEETFPTWWNVAECAAAFGMTPEAPVQINPVYVTLCASAFKRGFPHHWTNSIKVFQKEKGDPYLITAPHITEALFIVMPKRVDDLARPDWFVEAYPEPQNEAAE